MKLNTYPLLLVILVVLMMPLVQAASPVDSVKTFMDPYEKIQVALAADDLASAQSAAKNLPQDKNAQAIVTSKSLDEARTAFQPLSKTALGISVEDKNYYAFKCPMLANGYWVQTTDKTANPYFGKSMLGCGNVLSKEAAKKVAPAQEGKMSSMPGM